MHFIIRADADTQIGTGHVMRCLALAQSCRSTGISITFATAIRSAALEAHLKFDDIDVAYLSVQAGSADDASQMIALAQHRSASWIILDGYHFSADYQRIIKGFGLNLLTIDDYRHAAHYYADIVVNQNLHAHMDLYESKECYTQLLLGVRYVLLRKQFLKYQGWKRRIPKVASKMLVTLGGSDPGNATLKVIRAIQKIKAVDLEIVVVLGGNNPHYEELQFAIQDLKFPVRLQSNVTSMSSLMAWADVAVSAGGSTCWELAFMGLPNIGLLLADNQRFVLEKLDELGVLLSLGWYDRITVADIGKQLEYLLLSFKDRSQMSSKGQHLVDGEGCHRVLASMKCLPLRLRPVEEENSKLLWEWVNDSAVRKSSFQSEFISWAKHARWLSEKLDDPQCFQFIALDNHNIPVGQVRFEVEDGEAEIDVSVDKNKRGLGYGSPIITMGVEELSRTIHINAIHAFVKLENRVSIRAFQRAGFENQNITEIKQCTSMHLVWKNDK